MQYSFFLAWRYMRKNIGRTVYSVFGIMVTFLLIFSIFTTGYSIWDYAYLAEGGDRSHLWVNEFWTNEEDELVGIQQEQIEQVKKLAQCDEVKSLTIQHFEDAIDAGEAEDEAFVRIEIALDDLRPGDDCFIRIGLKDVSDLQKSAESLQEQTGLSIEVDEGAAAYFGQGESSLAEAYHAVMAILAAFFSFFCVMLLRNTMTVSVVERMQDYGLWRCVGMSEKQLYRQLAVEGFLMSLLAAVCGIGISFGLLRALTPRINNLLELQVPFSFGFYPEAVIETTLLCLGVTLFSLLEPARQAGNISPIEAIHNNIVLQRRSGKLREKIQYRQSRVWTKLFGVSGEYAYKNMCRNRGRSLALFFSLMFSVILLGVTQSGTESLYASVENLYQGKDVEYLEYIDPGKIDFDPVLAEQLQEELCQLDTVRKTAVLYQKGSIRSLDKELQQYFDEGKVNDCEHNAYDRETIEHLQKYILEGEADYDAMTEQNGVLLWDMSYNVSDRGTDFTQTDVRKTEYQVGDKITEISEEGRERAWKVYEKALRQVAELAGLPATQAEYDAAWEQKQEEAREAGEYLNVTESHQYIPYPLEYMTKEDQKYRKYQGQILECIAEQGIQISPEEIAGLHTDPDTGESTGTEMIGDILDILEQREYDAGARTEYVIQGILEEEPISGGVAMVNFWNPIILVHSQDAVLKSAKISNDTSQVVPDIWGWVIQVARDAIDLENEELERYCDEKSRNSAYDLSVWYVFEGTEWDAREYLDMIKTLNIVQMITLLITSYIGIICLILIFNTICSNIVLRRKELHLYRIVGMDRGQKCRMLFLEHGVMAVAAVVFGYLASWGLSWYLIDYLLNQDGVICYDWPWFFMLLICAGVLFLVELVSFLGIHTSAEY